MRDISLPEVRLKGKLPEGLRDLSLDDIQKAMPDVHLPDIDLGRETRRLGGDARKAGKDARKAAERTARDARKSVSKEAGKAARAVENVLPRRRGPNPVPIAILAMLGGVAVGWLLSSNPVTGPRIQALMSDLKARLDEWRGRGTDDFDDQWDTADVQAFPDSLRAPIASEPYSGDPGVSETGLSTATGELPEGMGTSDPDSVGATDGSRTTGI